VPRRGALWGHCAAPFWPKRFVQLALTTALWFVLGGIALATEKPAVSIGPTRLSDRQLDHITAGATTFGLDLSASAQGLNASASTAGTIQSGNATIMQVDLSPGAPARLVSTTQATIIIAAGEATASGTDGAQCSATIQASGTYSFLRVVSETTNLPPAAPGLPYIVTCACGALAIAPH
jgi:hypothetical protein